MAHNKDYVPDRDGDFDGWLANLTAYVEEKTAAGAWTHIPPEKVQGLKGHQRDWHADYQKTLGPHSSADTRAKNDARAGAERFVRPFVQQYLKFDPVSPEDRRAMNLPSRERNRKVLDIPAARALIIGLKPLGGFQVEVRFQDEGAQESRAIPYGMNGCLLNYAWGPEKLWDYGLLKDSILMTRAPWVITLPPEAEGAFFSAAVRWQSRRGKLGPWGDIHHSVVG